MFLFDLGAFQIETTVLFLLEQQGLLANRIAVLGKKQEVISNILELREAYRDVGRDLLKLLSFVEINSIGLRKILKKFDKRFGYRFTNYYVKTRANHPYSQLQQVFKHVGLGAVVGAISRNLSDLQERQGSYLYIYDHHTLPLQVLFIIGNKRCLQHHSRWLGDASKAELEKLFSETSFEVLVLSGVAAAGECKSMLPSRETSADTETGDVKVAGKMCGCT
ncbi:SPX domain-containing protein [Heracleum sosnowskyi]|uniref:SPX domain-containing protein n=1 Tax=Heracleum sosnowskyi TaxID=360622 RepID=A0AAD8MBN8_9APIA|nr:SPX domain-containing protein [Heracleum sosnowskyi]